MRAVRLLRLGPVSFLRTSYELDLSGANSDFTACRAEGVRPEISSELAPNVQELHQKSLTDARDMIKDASPEDKKRWLAKDGMDWSGAFGQDPAKLIRSRQSIEHKRERGGHNDNNDDDDELDNDDDTDSDLETASVTANGDARADDGLDSAAERKRAEKRHHRGPRQWKPVREMDYFRTETMIGLRKVKNKLTGNLQGRDPKVESEAGA